MVFKRTKINKNKSTNRSLVNRYKTKHFVRCINEVGLTDMMVFQPTLLKQLKARQATEDLMNLSILLMYFSRYREWR